jgi:hypothetical protein
MARKTINILPFLIILILLSSKLIAQQMHVIPTQVLNLYKLLGITTIDDMDTVQVFEISDFITYKEYKEYLASMKKDSSISFYKNQFPDTNIAFKKEVYVEYMNSSEYDNYPVLGISWDNAMNYCKWKTLKENKDSIRFIYRLPDCSQWLSSLDYLTKQKIKNDFNQNYSDWLMDSKDESSYNFQDDFHRTFQFNYVYFHKKTDPPALKRKFVIGDSYLYQKEKLVDYYDFSYYSYEGYRQIAFRIVKEYRQFFRDYHNKYGILKYWDIIK